MPNSKIIFIELTLDNKLKYVCDIIEKLYSSNKKVHIFAGSNSDAKRIDEHLWTFKQDTFIPHKLSKRLSDKIIEPIIISTETDLSAQADVLVEFDPLELRNLQNYELIIDFAETYNSQNLQNSRNRYKKARDSNQFSLEFTSLGQFLGTEITDN